ncbi:Chitotriosidase-1 [Erysiphe neolycopersici]|uniref:chitinase n=1 Tax=Erysiphe neolycopersici TaxID=212602 RepID=A0A420I193_9PEZI|nr:Chitotriosidase-1 [Erysiphe neolycopersici]
MLRIASAFLSLTLSTFSVTARYVFYYDEYHVGAPDNAVTSGIDHVIISSASSNLFTTSPPKLYQPFESITTTRSYFNPGTKVLISIGGWGDTEGFGKAAATEESRKIFAANIALLCDQHGFDGVDIMWEYPAGNGQDYRQIPNSYRISEIDTYPLLLGEIRRAIGPNRLLTIATPGRVRDMIAYTPEKAPLIWIMVDWVNVMTYDFINSRDNTTAHHSDVKKSLEIIDYYINDLQLDPQKINLGVSMYARFFKIDTAQPCDTGLGCATELLEDQNGLETGNCGTMTFQAENYRQPPNDIAETTDGTCGIFALKKCPDGQCCSTTSFCGTSPEFCNSCQGNAFGTGCQVPSTASLFQTAMANGIIDDVAGGQYYFDRGNNLFWTWDTPALIARKLTEIVEARRLGGVMAWSLGQDSFDFSHILALRDSVTRLSSIP